MFPIEFGNTQAGNIALTATPCPSCPSLTCKVGSLPHWLGEQKRKAWSAFSDNRRDNSGNAAGVVGNTIGHHLRTGQSRIGPMIRFTTVESKSGDAAHRP